MKNIKDPNEQLNTNKNNSAVNQDLSSRAYYGSRITNSILYTKTSYVPKDSLL